MSENNECKKAFCALCNNLCDKDSPVLAMGPYGNPRLLCPECAELVETITLGTEYDSITSAMDEITKRMSKSNVDDGITVDTMTDLLARSAERAQKIKDGSYDFSLDEAEEEEDSFDEIPEELQETEEDRLLDEKEAEANRKFDKLLNWMWVGVAVAVVGILAYRLISALI